MRRVCCIVKIINGRYNVCMPEVVTFDNSDSFNRRLL
jgi:hypothetical protein